MLTGWSGWWDCGPFVCFLILHGKHVTQKYYVKEANYDLQVVECDLGWRRAEGEGQGRPWHLLKHQKGF